MGAEAQHPSEERQLALLVGQASDYAIFTLDPEGLIRSWNPGAERMKRYTREDVIGKHFSIFYTEEDRARDHPADELRIAAAVGRYEEEGWRVRKDGSRFWAHVVITALRDEDGTLVGFGKVSRDLTAQRLAEEELRAKAAELEAVNRELLEYRRLVSSVRDYAIFMLDPAGHVLSWNIGARRLKGYDAEEIIGKHFSAFYSEADRARNHPEQELRIAVREGRYEEEGWRIRKDGTRFWASVTITAVRDEEERLTGFAKVTRDLTERKRNEEALQNAVAELSKANEELDRFAVVAAHDMADPLRTISGYAEVLVETEPSREDARRFARHILDSSLRLSSMLRGLLAYARAGADATDSVAVELATAVVEVIDDIALTIRDRNVRVEVAVPPDARVTIAPSDLRVVLQNLVSNAVKFSDRETPAISVRAERQGEDWCVSVLDDGPGIAPEHQKRIFGAFERIPGKATGYGLGLAICQRIVERHGGRIGVESPQRGTRFWFTLPAAGPGADQGPRQPALSSSA